MHLTEQTDQPSPTVFKRKCWASCTNGVNVILQKYGKGGGGTGRMSLPELEFYFHASLLVCLLLVSLPLSLSLSLSVFCLLVVFFFVSNERNNFNVDVILYYIICFCLRLFIQRTSIVRKFLRR